MTPEQTAGWEAKLAIHNADITRSNLALTEHNALLPEGTPPVALRPLLTLQEYIAYEMNRIAEAGQRQAQASAKTNLELLNERDAALAQVAAVTADILVVVAERDTLTTDLATANASIATLTSQVASLESQLQEMTESKDVLFIRKQAVDHDLVEANAKIAFLESIRQFNPRWTTPDFFINRFTAKEAKAFYSSEDAMIVGGQQLLEAYEAAGWYVDLDDTQVQGLTGYMVQLGMMTPERREQVLRDATAAEAWYPQ